MNIIDIVVLIILSIGLIKGFIKGAIGEIFGLLALVGSIAICYLMHTTFLNFINHFLSTEYNSSITYITSFIIVYLVILLLGRLLTKTVHAMALGPINKIAGSIIAMSKYALILLLILYVIVFVFTVLNQEIPSIILQSETFKVLNEARVFELIHYGLNSGKNLTF